MELFVERYIQKLPGCVGETVAISRKRARVKMQARDFKLQLLGKLHRDLTPEPGPPDRQRQFRRVLRVSGVWQAAEIAHRIKLPGRLRQKKTASGRL